MFETPRGLKHLQRAHVLSLVGELRSHMPHGEAKQKTTKDTQIRSHSELRSTSAYEFGGGVAVYHLILNSGREEIF